MIFLKLPTFNKERIHVAGVNLRVPWYLIQFIIALAYKFLSFVFGPLFFFWSCTESPDLIMKYRVLLDLFFWFSLSYFFLFNRFITSRKYLMEDFLGWHYHHTGTSGPWQRSVTSFQHQGSQRLGHGHPQYRLMQLPITPCLHSGKSVDLVYSFVLSTL